ncbi:MAG TPA: 1-deoxy-D-xylulose-5-phosphate synthase, partial [Jatrophihabitantaceae bacterium]
MANVLGRVGSPADLRALNREELALLAAEIRDLLVQTVSRTGGHLGPNLGAVELTIALHRSFDSPTEPILFDVGHQAYVHKMLTGRAALMPGLRQTGGLSGYPNRAESPDDWIENSHASTALSYADGLAKAFAVRSERRPVVTVVGDGALTGGMCWEALNNIAAADRPVIIVVNDNGRSYSPTIGGLAEHLSGLRLRPGYEKMLGRVKGALERTPVVGAPLYDALHGVKRGIKDMVAPQGMFEDLGLKYLGPVDGHDVEALEHAFGLARGFDGPVIVHCVTRKGYGYAPAENDEADQMHQSRGFDPATGVARRSTARTWTAAFADELVKIGDERDDIVAITAAMCDPTGLHNFKQRFPARTFDVGIAEQHAVTSAAGLAFGGLHPVVAIYATFLNRAFDQVLLDVALHRLPVTFVLDRAGITGDDGPSHNGVWDLAVFGVVPGLRIAAPRDEPTLRALLREAVAIQDGPSMVRFPKTPLGA